ncbi:hypothetical protein TRICI_004837 [Trichomonascus ciferrii]|uniref:Uncharacterized protein n=1 Tax=Trichomonascus ciferrii TaxID=44093 RepID=A0A642V0H1_9ASCO|nr:hypothetical protein TRICI_004837 [Trichomonascus ciferrii]
MVVKAEESMVESDTSLTPASELSDYEDEDEYRIFAEKEGLSAPRTVTGRISNMEALDYDAMGGLDVLATQLFTQTKVKEEKREKRRKEKEEQEKKAMKAAQHEVHEMFLPQLAGNEFCTPRSKRRRLNSDVELTGVKKDLAYMKMNVNKQKHDVYFYRTVGSGGNPYMGQVESSPMTYDWYEFIKTEDIRFWLFSGSVFANFKSEVYPSLSDACIKWLENEIIREDRGWLREKYCQAWLKTATLEADRCVSGRQDDQAAVCELVLTTMRRMFKLVGMEEKVAGNTMTMEPQDPRPFNDLVVKDPYLTFPMIGQIGSVINMLKDLALYVFRTSQFSEHIYLYLLRMLFISSVDCNVCERSSDILCPAFARLVDSVPQDSWDCIFDTTIELAFNLFTDLKLRNRLLDLFRFAVTESTTPRMFKLRIRLATAFYLGTTDFDYTLTPCNMLRQHILPTMTDNPFYSRRKCQTEAKKNPNHFKYQLNFLFSALSALPKCTVIDTDPPPAGTDEDTVKTLHDCVNTVRIALARSVENPKLIGLRRAVCALHTFIQNYYTFKRELF